MKRIWQKQCLRLEKISAYRCLLHALIDTKIRYSCGQTVLGGNLAAAYISYFALSQNMSCEKAVERSLPIMAMALKNIN